MFPRSDIRAQILGRDRFSFAAHGFCTLALALAGAASLTACGQKGALFFPPPPKALPTAGVTPAAPTSTLGTAVETPNIAQPPPAAPPTSAPR